MAQRAGQVGSEISEYRAGDLVMCSGAGGYAEFAVSDLSRTNPLPSTTTDDNGYDLKTAAALPVALQTMHDAIVTNGELQKDDSVLILGASSGVGIIGMQIAKFMGAAKVFGTSTNNARRTELTRYGADLTFDTNDREWPAQVMEATEGKGVNLVVDQISAGTIRSAMKCAAILGRIVNVGRLGGMTGDFDFDLHARKRLQYIGVTFRTRSFEEVLAINTAMRRDLWPALEQRKFDIPIHQTFPLAQANEAQRYMANNQHFGKILLEL
jgi:NADPH2:quinone reductase